jgi:hypothetical protein
LRARPASTGEFLGPAFAQRGAGSGRHGEPPQNGWSPSLQDAEIAEGKEAAEALLARGQTFFEPGNFVLDVYLFEVERTEAGIRAASVRETIRQAGPTVRVDLGKQAELEGVHA